MTSSVRDEAARLLDRVASGELLMGRVEAAAHLGHAAALEAAPQKTPKSFRLWSVGIGDYGIGSPWCWELCVRAAVAAINGAMALSREGGREVSPGLEGAVRAVERWLVSDEKGLGAPPRETLQEVEQARNLGFLPNERSMLVFLDSLLSQYERHRRSADLFSALKAAGAEIKKSVRTYQIALKEIVRNEVAPWLLGYADPVVDRLHPGAGPLADHDEDDSEGDSEDLGLTVVYAERYGPEHGDEALAELPGDVTKLNLGRSSVTDAGLTQLGRLGKLRELLLFGTGVSGEGLATLAGKRLTALSLSESPVTSAGTRALALSTALEELVLSKTGVTDAGLVHLENLRDLERLDVSETRITGSSLRSLTNLPLRRLDLSYCPLEPGFARSLVRLNELRSLALRDCSAATCEELAVLANHPTLLYLDLVGSPAMEDIETLATALPRVSFMDPETWLYTPGRELTGYAISQRR